MCFHIDWKVGICSAGYTWRQCSRLSEKGSQKPNSNSSSEATSSPRS